MMHTPAPRSRLPLADVRRPEHAAPPLRAGGLRAAFHCALFAALTLLTGLVAPSACTLALATEDQCKVDADCAARGLTDGTCQAGVCTAGAVISADRWACLGKPLQLEGPDPATIVLPINDGVSQNVPQVNFVKICEPLDLECANGRSARFEADGTIYAEVTRGFRGRLFISAKDTLPYEFIFTRPVDSTTPHGADSLGRAPLFAQATLEALLVSVSLKYDPKLAYAIFQVLDCNGAPAEGIIASAGGASVIYTQNRVPTPKLQATSASGDGAVAAVTPGYQTLRFELPNGQVVSESTHYLRAGYGYALTVLPNEGSTAAK